MTDNCGDDEPLPDVTKMSPSEREKFFADDQGVYGRVIKKIIKSLDDPDGVISAFQNYVS